MAGRPGRRRRPCLRLLPPGQRRRGASPDPRSPGGGPGRPAVRDGRRGGRGGGAAATDRPRPRACWRARVRTRTHGTPAEAHRQAVVPASGIARTPRPPRRPPAGCLGGGGDPDVCSRKWTCCGGRPSCGPAPRPARRTHGDRPSTKCCSRCCHRYTDGRSRPWPGTAQARCRHGCRPSSGSARGSAATATGTRRSRAPSRARRWISSPSTSSARSSVPRPGRGRAHRRCGTTPPSPAVLGILADAEAAHPELVADLVTRSPGGRTGFCCCSLPGRGQPARRRRSGL